MFSFFYHLADLEVEELIEKLKECTEERMRIEMAPWQKGYTVAMDELYTELTLEKIDNKPTGPEGQVLDDYQELFIESEVSSNGQQTSRTDNKKKLTDCSVKIEQLANSSQKTFNAHFKSKKRVKSKGKRILVKADPGFGKTTFSKKIAYDWATDILKKISILFCIFLKLVQPGETIENIIFQQYPEFESLNIGQQTLKQILESFNNKCLIIFDGLDEYELGRNDDIFKIIEGRKLSHCNVLLTSRPHCLSDVLSYFQTIVSIHGFTADRAKTFVSCILKDQNEVDKVLKFNSEMLCQQQTLHSSPMLLLFVCILVNSQEIVLQSETMSLGEMYMRLVRCLYCKFVTHKGSGFKKSEFVDLLKRVGKVAWETLQSGKSWFQNSELIELVGEDVFLIGLIIGNKDFRLLGNETADIFVTFPHRTMQEFLGSFYFIAMIDENIPGFLIANTIFLTNHWFFHFCLYFVGSSQSYFNFHHREIYEKLKYALKEKLDLIQFDCREIGTLFPGLAYVKHLDEMELQFDPDIVGDLLPICNNITDYIMYEMISITPLSHLKNLRLIVYVDRMEPVIGPRSFLKGCLSADEFSVVINHPYTERVGDLLNYCRSMPHEKKIALYILQKSKTADLCDFLKGNIRKVHISGDSSLSQYLAAKENINVCPFLIQLSLENMSLDSNVAVVLSRAVKDGSLPLLYDLNVNNCGTALKGKLPILFESQWPALTHLNLKGCYLDETDLHTLVLCVVDPEHGMIPRLTSLALDFGNPSRHEERHKFNSTACSMFQFPFMNIKTLHLHNICNDIYKHVLVGLNGGNLPQLVKLCISLDKHLNFSSRDSYPIQVPALTDLRLHRLAFSPELLTVVSKGATSSQLHKLDISHSSGITGNLSVLLCDSFPSLNSLILSNCGLNSQDLCSLAQASVESRLPQLIDLDISVNKDLVGQLNCLFEKHCNWGTLANLNITKVEIRLKDDCQLLASKIASGCLRSLKILKISSCAEDSLFSRITVPMNHLERIETFCHPRNIWKILESVSVASEGEFLPALDTIVIGLSSLPTTAEDFTSQVQELWGLVNQMIETIFYSLRVNVFCNCSQNSALGASVDPLVRECLSIGLPEHNSDSELDILSSSIQIALKRFLSSNNELDVLTCETYLIVAYVLSHLDVPLVQRFENTKLISAIEAIVNLLKSNVFDQGLSCLKQDPLIISVFLDALDPPVADRISATFFDADPEVLESVTIKFTHKLTEILVNGSDDYSSELKKSLIPLVADKFAALYGMPVTDQITSLMDMLASGKHIDRQTCAQLMPSCWSSEVKWKLHKRGIRIYLLHQPDLDILTDNQDTPDNEVFISQDKHERNLSCDMMNSTLGAVQCKVYNQFQLNSSEAMVLVASLDPPIRDRLCGTFLDLDSKQLDELSRTISASVANCLWLETNWENVAEFSSVCDSWIRYVLSHLDDSHFKLEETKLASVIESIVVSLIVATPDLQITERLSNVFPDVDPEVLESATTQFSQKRFDTVQIPVIPSLNRFLIKKGKQNETEHEHMEEKLNPKVQAFRKAVDEAILKILASAVVVCFSPSVHEALGVIFPETNIKALDAFRILSEREHALIIEDTLERSLYDTQLEKVQLASLMWSKLRFCRESLIKVSENIRENPSHASELVAALDISILFRGADPALLESVTKELIEKLVEILPDLLDGRVSYKSYHEMMKKLFKPLFDVSSSNCEASSSTVCSID